MQEGCNKGKQHAELHIFAAAPQKAPAGPAPAKIPFQHPTGAARRWRAPNEAARAVRRPEQQQRPPRFHKSGMAGRGRGTAGRGRGAPPLGPDDRDTIRAQLDVLRAPAQNHFLRRPARLTLY